MKHTTLRWFFGLLLIATAIGKLLDNRGFANVIQTYDFGIPPLVALPLALAVSLFELALGLALLRRIRPPTAALATVGLHLGYVLLAVITNLRGLQLTNCGCFGVFWGRSMTWMTVVEDLALLFLSLLLWRSSRGAAAA